MTRDAANNIGKRKRNEFERNVRSPDHFQRERAITRSPDGDRTPEQAYLACSLEPVVKGV